METTRAAVFHYNPSMCSYLYISSCVCRPLSRLPRYQMYAAPGPTRPEARPSAPSTHQTCHAPCPASNTHKHLRCHGDVNKQYHSDSSPKTTLLERKGRVKKKGKNSCFPVHDCKSLCLQIYKGHQVHVLGRAL